jgi:hypothetical protein
MDGDFSYGVWLSYKEMKKSVHRRSDSLRSNVARIPSSPFSS